MRLLITRSEPDAGELKAELQALGHSVSVEPLLRIELLPIAAEALAGAQALLATSRNGVRALTASDALAAACALPVLCVGEETAALARAAGIKSVASGAGTAQDLVPLVVSKLAPGGGLLVHVAGEQLAFDLASALAEHCFAVNTITAYRTLAGENLSKSTALEIASGSIDGVILMSPRTAAIFARLIKSAGLAGSARGLHYICMSEAVAEALGDLAPDRRTIAKSPNRAAIIAAVGRVATRATGV